jgi:hypothetical protein
MFWSSSIPVFVGSQKQVAMVTLENNGRENLVVVQFDCHPEKAFFA